MKGPLSKLQILVLLATASMFWLMIAVSHWDQRSIVPAEIRSLSDLDGRTPVEFIEVLQKRENDNYSFDRDLKDWITKRDVAQLLPLVDSKVPCANVSSSYSSYWTTQNSTVGQEAEYMLLGFQVGKYPPTLNSGSMQPIARANLIQWCRDEIGESRVP